MKYEQLISLLRKESVGEYLSKEGMYLTPERLEIFRRCPLMYRDRRLGLLYDGHRERAARQLRDEAVSVCIFQGYAAYEYRYKHLMPLEDADLVESLADVCRSWGWLQARLTDGSAGVVVRANYAGAMCQARIDWFRPGDGPDAGIYALVFSSRQNIRETPLDPTVRKLAFTRSLLQLAATERGLPAPVDLPAHIILLQREMPHDVAGLDVSEDDLQRAQQQNEYAVERLIEYDRTSLEWAGNYPHRCQRCVFSVVKVL